MKQSVRMMILGALALMSSVHTAWAGYKPVDVSDIKGEQRKQLMEAVRGVNKMPAPAKDCYVCEQLGLCFHMDGREAGSIYHGYPGTSGGAKAKFVSKTGRLSAWRDAVNSAGGQWGKSWDEAHQFKPGAVLSFFEKNVDSIVHNTAKYLLKEMPDITRYAMLASIGRMLYKADGTTLPASGYSAKVRIGSGFDVNYNGNASDGYSFIDPTGRECSLQEAFAADAKKKRWRDTVRRCENLIGARDILALFPEEVKAMRRHYKQRLAQVKEQKDAIANEAIKQADAMLQTLPSDAQERLIAEAAGMYYDPENYGYSGTDWKTTSVSAKGALYLGNGSKVYGPCNDGDAPVVRELLRNVPHRVILEHYAEALKKMARYMARDRFQNMPGTLRDALLCELTGKLTTADGSPAVDGETTINLEVPDPARRTVPIPCAKVNADKARFTTSRGVTLPYSTIKSYLSQYARSVQLAHLCALILGPEELAKCIPQGGEEEKEELPQTPQKSAMGSTTNEPVPAPTEKPGTPRKTAMGSTSNKSASVQQAPSSATGKPPAMPAAAGEVMSAEKSKAILNGANQMMQMQKVSPDLKNCFIAEAVGLHYKTESQGGYNHGWNGLEPAATMFLPDGRRTNGYKGIGSTKPTWLMLQNVPLDALIAEYKEPVQQMAKHMLADRLKGMPALLRDALVAELTGKLKTEKGSSPVQGNTTIVMEAGSRQISVSHPSVMRDSAIFTDSQGNTHSYNEIAQYEAPYIRSIQLVYLCAYILGPEEFLKCIP